MEEIKNAITNLEEAILQLETAVYRVKKAYVQSAEHTAELKEVVRTAYVQIDKMLTEFKQGEE